MVQIGLLSTEKPADEQLKKVLKVNNNEVIDFSNSTAMSTVDVLVIDAGKELNLSQICDWILTACQQTHALVCVVTDDPQPEYRLIYL